MELMVSTKNYPDWRDDSPAQEITDLKGMGEEEIIEFCLEAGEPAYRGRQIFSWIYAKGETDLDRMSDLPRAFREELARRARVGWLEPEKVEKGADGIEKFLWRLGDGNLVESVRVPMPLPDGKTRWSFCISTQVGCAMGCAFCLTAKMGFVRQLSAGEIVEQFLAARRLLPEGERYHNVVFMGMGEPLDNLEASVAAVRLLTHPKGVGMSPRRLTLSTVGIAPKLLEFVREVPGVGVAVSLHAADDVTRGKIVPPNRKWPLNEILTTCRNLPLSERQRITFEYVLLSGVNDSPEDARKLAGLLRGIRCKVNLLPWNPFPDVSFERPADSRVGEFRRILTQSGLDAFVRQSKGLDIRAACGQLADDDKIADRAGRRS
ncbi:MAG: 23S rRNA (adenine(2503)-C(2))-methyltransferase RlmN [Nitrospinota bacterium]|jgi:23S rRNA (adenine2503-C2)-methyltransferase|nr:23S rRNA (adenine(2503)-C(2))-methyltransferase RlmN [Nitrospinota bacterium]